MKNEAFPELGPSVIKSAEWYVYLGAFTSIGGDPLNAALCVHRSAPVGEEHALALERLSTRRYTV